MSTPDTYRVTLVLPSRVVPAALRDQLARDPHLKDRIQVQNESGHGLVQEAVVAVLAHGALIALFRVLHAWVLASRTRAKVRVRTKGVDVEVTVDGRVDANALVQQVVDAVTGGGRPAR